MHVGATKGETVAGMFGALDNGGRSALSKGTQCRGAVPTGGNVTGNGAAPAGGKVTGNGAVPAGKGCNSYGVFHSSGNH